jgi:hypothetical protein
MVYRPLEDTMEDKTLKILEKYLDGDFRVSPMAPNKSTMIDITELEKNIGNKISRRIYRPSCCRRG